jgi:uncharacterized protein (TIGR00251 family)
LLERFFYLFSIEERSDGVVFKVYVQPRSSENRIVGIHGDALKIKLTAAPVDNAANKMCLKYLAGSLGVSSAALEIVAGHSSRSKIILWQFPGRKATADSARRFQERLKSLLPSQGR